ASLSSSIDDERAQLGHLLDRVADPFASGAGVLHAAVRVVVGPEGRDLTDHQSAHLELLERAMNAPQIVREEPRLETERRVVRPTKRLVEGGMALKGDARAERLFADDPGLRGRILDARRLDQRSLAAAPRRNAGPSGSRFLDPSNDPLRVLFVD